MSWELLVFKGFQNESEALDYMTTAKCTVKTTSKSTGKRRVKQVTKDKRCILCGKPRLESSSSGLCMNCAKKKNRIR